MFIFNSIVFSQLNIQSSPVDNAIDAGAQKQQIINVECVSDFSDPPSLVITFLLVHRVYDLTLQNGCMGYCIVLAVCRLSVSGLQLHCGFTVRDGQDVRC